MIHFHINSSEAQEIINNNYLDKKIIKSLVDETNNVKDYEYYLIYETFHDDININEYSRQIEMSLSEFLNYKSIIRVSDFYKSKSKISVVYSDNIPTEDSFPNLKKIDILKYPSMLDSLMVEFDTLEKSALDKPPLSDEEYFALIDDCEEILSDNKIIIRKPNEEWRG
jgi:hypothetical protein